MLKSKKTMKMRRISNFLGQFQKQPNDESSQIKNRSDKYHLKVTQHWVTSVLVG